MYVGIGCNYGLTVEKENAIDYVLRCYGIRVDGATKETHELLEMLEEWYFSGDWIWESE